MKLPNNITVHKPASEIWQMLGPDFVDVARWMAAIPRSVEKTEGKMLPGAPAIGRYSYLISKMKPAYQDETITKYDAATRSLSIQVVVRDFPGGTPMNYYNSDVSVSEIDANTSEVTWNSYVSLRPFGYLLYPVLRKSMNAGFIRNLEEIKHIMETGQPHPRKIEKIESERLATATIPA